MENQLASTLQEAAFRTVSYFESQLDNTGSYGDQASDLSCYYKSPMMFLYAKKPEMANQILDHIKANFMTKEGDFLTDPETKSAKPEYTEFWCYTNGWITRAAYQLNRSDIDDAAYPYMMQFYSDKQNGFLANSLEKETGITDAITTAHNGLINLERNNLPIAITAGNYLCEMLQSQPDLDSGFYLRRNAKGDLITDDQSPFYFVNKKEPEQLYFMIGYPAAYLALLYEATKDQKYLDAANGYLNVALTGHESVYRCGFSHKIAWAASILYKIKGDAKYLTPIERITNYFIEEQSDSGIWYLDQDINTAYDQSAEIACWLLDIANNLKAAPEKQSTASKEKDKQEGGSWVNTTMKYGTIALIVGVGLYAARRYCATDGKEQMFFARPSF